MGLTAALLLGGIGLQTASMIQAGRAAEAQAEGEEAMAEYNARVAEQQAKATELKTKFDQRRAAERAQRILGTLRAGLGGAGAISEEGAPLALITEQAEELALENALIGYEGQVRAGQFRSQAGLYGMEAQLAGSRAKAAMPAAYLGAGGTLLTGFGTMMALGVGGKSAAQRAGVKAGVPKGSVSRIRGRTPSGGFIFG